ncbi:uncharacterized protein LOC144628000 [Oculina patagonica]
MGSPCFDLGSLCSSPLLYQEGEDFLGQPVNTFFDEDNSFDFIDTFEAGLSIAGNANEVSAAKTQDTHQYLIREGPLELTTQQGHSCKEKDFINGNGGETLCEQVKVSSIENSASLHNTSVFESLNTCTNEVSPSSENVESKTLTKNAEELTQSAGRQNATETDNVPSSSHDKDRVKTGSETEALANATIPEAVLPEDLEKNSEQNAYINSSFNEKPTCDNLKLLSLEGHTNCENESHAIKIRKSIKGTDFKRPENNANSFALKNSAFKRCVVPKTFYSPFWTPEKSTAGHEKSLKDGLVNAQRNMDILCCCNCKSQKRDPKHIGVAMKPSPGTITTSLKDTNQYIDFLKRNSAVKPQGNHRKTRNKTINGEISGHVCNEENNNSRWISLPAIGTSFKTARQKTSNNRQIGAVYSRTLSVASIDRLINKYKGTHFDLVEQQKRYQLKPFK